jgi:hypothetical protein
MCFGVYGQKARKSRGKEQENVDGKVQYVQYVTRGPYFPQAVENLAAYAVGGRVFRLRQR